jgi:hypothetical protein
LNVPLLLHCLSLYLGDLAEQGSKGRREMLKDSREGSGTEACCRNTCLPAKSRVGCDCPRDPCGRFGKPPRIDRFSGPRLPRAAMEDILYKCKELPIVEPQHTVFIFVEQAHRGRA